MAEVVSLTLRPRFIPPKEDFWYSFLLEAEQTPGPQCGRKGHLNTPKTILCTATG
jgi:hypothetical protein